MINFHNTDNMKFMADVPDKYYDLAICDIPYGIDVANMPYLKEVNTTVKQKNGTRINGNKNKDAYTQKDWDEKTPTQQYFDELKRVSKHQIIFGIDCVNWDGIGSGRIIWDKGFAKGMSFKRYERAYCSLIDEVIELPLLWAGMMQAKSLSQPMIQQGNKKLNEKRIHPTQKPILLYMKLLLDYARRGYNILDTHGGSGSHAIAADILTSLRGMDLNLDICEIDAEYYTKSVNRFKQYKSQQTIQF